ncbi:hypothetical protein T484DRAFT_1861635 [Baffinella frigidus]|nr:hypothetical protein T484DRAFT_1861635 [Cryptophyta sp. CCMP2293]
MSSVEHLGYAGVSPAPSQASVNQESAAERRRNIAKLVAACAVSAAVFCAMLVSGASSSTEAASSGQSAISNTWQKLVAVGGGDTDAEPMEAIEPVPHRSEDRLKELLNHWVPITGMILSIFLDFAPLEQILLCRRSKSMGQVNADVFPFLFGNNVGWVMYASLTHNFYMFVACFPSVMLAMFYILTGYMLAASDAARVRIETTI